VVAAIGPDRSSVCPRTPLVEKVMANAIVAKAAANAMNILLCLIRHLPETAEVRVEHMIRGVPGEWGADELFTTPGHGCSEDLPERVSLFATILRKHGVTPVECSTGKKWPTETTREGVDHRLIRMVSLMILKCQGD
jgi:hypothetical protein